MVLIGNEDEQGVGGDPNFSVVKKRAFHPKYFVPRPPPAGGERRRTQRQETREGGRFPLACMSGRPRTVEPFVPRLLPVCPYPSPPTRARRGYSSAFSFFYIALRKIDDKRSEVKSMSVCFFFFSPFLFFCCMVRIVYYGRSVVFLIDDFDACGHAGEG
ncbi:hypothetical protein B0H14DRAFT_354665 [Mycena olivaceomarginata]|nr:hypothetical protein B0H14DRAFT_354665 [Mycena olivaceomarginata]